MCVVCLCHSSCAFSRLFFCHLLAMGPSTQPTELEVLRGRAAVLESEKHSAEQEIQDLRAQLFADQLDRATMRTQLFIMDQDYEKSCYQNGGGQERSYAYQWSSSSSSGPSSGAHSGGGLR